MMRKSLRVNSQAQNEINKAFDWYFERSPQSAEAFLDEIGDSLKRIVAGPHRFPISTKNTRRLVLAKFPYTVFFQEKDATILVVAVAHAKRRPGYWGGRVR